MKFSRTLSQSFINKLNNLYDSKELWWRKIADDEDVFILIRNDELRVQANGGLLLHIRQNQQQKLICKTRRDFISLPSNDKPFVILGDDSTFDEDSTIPSTKKVEGLNGFAKNYEEIKRRIGFFTKKEKRAVQYLANHRKNVVDIEVGYEGEMKENAHKTSVPRIDMAAISDNGTLVFFEVKLFDNNEIHSKEMTKETPKVADQLKKYKDWLDKCKGDIVTGYQDQLDVYRQLHGNFFVKRGRNHDILSLHPNSRLIITGFDASQRDTRLSQFLVGIHEGSGWAQKSKDLIAIGDHKKLARGNRLFLGL